MACGTGKTLVAPFLAERMEAKRVLVLVPSLSLLGQTLREWATATEFDYLAVCSDDTVTKDDHDAVVASTSELGVPVTTDAERIGHFLRRRRAGMTVVFSTYQSSPQIAAAQASRVPAFDLAVADEAHRCAGPQAGVFATVLDPTKIKARKRLFMTATPRYYTGRVKREASEADWEVASMDEEAKFGPVMHRLTFGHAIEQDLLSDYRVVVIGVTDDEALDLATRGVFVTHDGRSVTDARTLARQIGLLRAMAKHDLRRIVTFHSRIEYASRFAASLPGTNRWLPARRRPSGDLWTDHVSGQMTAGERDARLRRLSGVGADERGVLTNARCLTEGVDVPTLDCVAFIDSRRSQVDVVQAVGRAIRKADDKALGYIVVPVLVNVDSDPGKAVEASEFDRVWEVLRGLRDHDDDLADELDALRRELGRRGSIARRPTKIILDLPARIDRRFARAFDAKIVRIATRTWQEGLGAAIGYHRAMGHLRVPRDHVTEGGFRLGQWIQTQRAFRKRGLLSGARISELDALGMSWSIQQEDWLAGVAAAQQYREEYGDLLVPYAYVTEDGFRLGRWITKRRSEHRRGSLSKQRLDQLDSLGMVWDRRDEIWQRWLRLARTYRETNGHLRGADGALGRWLEIRRGERRRGALSPERTADLDALGMVWEPHDEDWQQGIGEASDYRRSAGHLLVPAKYVTAGGFRLGGWISARRAEHRRGQLSQSRVHALEALGMVWDPFDEEWQRGISAARAYFEENGHLRFPGGYVTDDGFRLERWIVKRRTERRAGTLSQERVAELDALGMSWEPLQDDWMRWIAAARAYRHEYGDLLVRASYRTPDGLALGAWISNRRKDRRRGLLTDRRIADLDSLGMVWEARRIAR
jgi:superfamily II DNA or RNA helicase